MKLTMKIRKTQIVATSSIMSSLLFLAGCTGVSEFKGNGSGTTVSTGGTTASTSTCQSIAVPAYIYPSYLGSGWNTAVSDAPFNPKVKRIMIMNPGSGPGTAPNSDYQNIVKTVHNAGGLVYGYVYTDYGSVALASAESQVSEYQTWYGVDGIFVDATSALTPFATTYYQPLANYITSQITHGGVILNVGTYPDPSYAAITVPSTSTLIINVFENDYATYESAGGIPAWATNYPPSLFMNIVYNTSAAQLANALTLSVQRNVGTVYITDGTLPNPYGQLPSYWSQLAVETQASCQ